MDFDESKLYDDILVKYRQRLDAVTFELERTLAQSVQKDQRIAELEKEITDSVPAEPPKPGPR